MRRLPLEVMVFSDERFRREDEIRSAQISVPADGIRFVNGVSLLHLVNRRFPAASSGSRRRRYAGSAHRALGAISPASSQSGVRASGGDGIRSPCTATRWREPTPYLAAIFRTTGNHRSRRHDTRDPAKYSPRRVSACCRKDAEIRADRQPRLAVYLSSRSLEPFVGLDPVSLSAVAMTSRSRFDCAAEPPSVLRRDLCRHNPFRYCWLSGDGSASRRSRPPTRAAPRAPPRHDVGSRRDHCSHCHYLRLLPMAPGYTVSRLRAMAVKQPVSAGAGGAGLVQWNRPAARCRRYCSALSAGDRRVAAS